MKLQHLNAKATPFKAVSPMGWLLHVQGLPLVNESSTIDP